jgi:hypothetical protein
LRWKSYLTCGVQTTLVAFASEFPDPSRAFLARLGRQLVLILGKRKWESAAGILILLW